MKHSPDTYRSLRYLIALAAIAFLASPGRAFSQPPSQEKRTETKPTKPNVLWVVTDDQRYDSIQQFNRILHNRDHSEIGYVESPNVDRLAREGTTFINSYCQAMGCAPSRASMHYGRYPFRSGVYEFEYHNNNASHCQPTLPERMAENGYQTLHIGKLGVRLKTVKQGRAKMHPIYQTDLDSTLLAKEGLADWGKGWFYELDGVKLDEPIRSAEFFISPDGTAKISNPAVESIPGHAGQSERVDKKYDLLRHYNEKKPKQYGSGMALAGVSPRVAGKTRDGYYASVFEDCLTNANREFKVGSKDVDGVDSDKPLFCHIGFDFPHTPVLPPADYRKRFQSHQYKIPQVQGDEMETMPRQMRNMVRHGYTDHFSDQEKQTMVQDYYAFCAYGDSLVGQAADAFIAYSEKQQQSWMIVYVCGDHGWKLNDHGSVSKLTPWDVDSHNPIIVVSSDKKAFPAGKVVTDFTEFVDIAPTILAAGGEDLTANANAYLDGYDLADVVSGKQAPREYVIGESHAGTGPRAYIRDKQYVLSLQTRPDKKRGDNMQWAMNASWKELDPGLYHMPTDPHEVKNLAFDPEHAAIAQAMKETLLDRIFRDGRVEVDWKTDGSGTQVFTSASAAKSNRAQ